jgi:RNA polymerase sigma factor (sigma-70 family)
VATRHINQVIQLCRTVLGPEQRMTDGQLLDSFITRKDPEAFEALVRRHGPMVLSVSRRLLRNHHDAEDAFQVVFLVLARKASTIKPRGMVGNWLHGVAVQTAQKANAMNTRRRVREKQVREIPEPATADPWHDLEPLLDRELSHLPEKYRLPIVLCDLEGKSIQEATRQLGWPQGTLAGRLSRARTMLARRLTRHGVVLSAGSLAVLLSKNTAACAPISLVTSTVKTASLITAGRTVGGMMSPKVVALMEGVMKAMLLTKLKSLTTVLGLAALLGIGIGALAYTAAASGQSEAPVAEKKKGGAPPVADNVDFTIKAQGNRLIVDVVNKQGKTRVYAAVANYQKSKGMLTLEGDADNSLVLETKDKSITIRGMCIKVTRDAIAVVPDGKTPDGLGRVQEAPLGEPGAAAAADPGSPPVPIPDAVARSLTLPDEKAIAGTWQAVDVEMAGLRLSETGDDKSKENFRKRKVVFWKGEIEGLVGSFGAERKQDHLTVEKASPDDGDNVRFELNPSTEPKRIDLILPGQRRLKGIYSLQKDSLVMAFMDGDGKGRPDDFHTSKDSRNIVLTLRRQPAAAGPAPPARVGQIIIVGNEKTSQNVILRQIKLRPGQVIDYPALRKAEKNLEALNRFIVDPKKGIRPTVTVVDPDGDNPYKDILVTVQERGGDRGKQPDEKPMSP